MEGILITADSGSRRAFHSGVELLRLLTLVARLARVSGLLPDSGGGKNRGLSRKPWSVPGFDRAGLSAGAVIGQQ